MGLWLEERRIVWPSHRDDVIDHRSGHLEAQPLALAVRGLGGRVWFVPTQGPLLEEPGPVASPSDAVATLGGGATLPIIRLYPCARMHGAAGVPCGSGTAWLAADAKWGETHRMITQMMNPTAMPNDAAAMSELKTIRPTSSQSIL